MINYWIQEGLSSDKHSIENGLIVQHSPNRPVMIDPQMQATSWLKRIYQVDSDFVSLKCFSENLTKMIEDCLVIGKTMLVEECGDVLPKMLNPIIMNQTFEEKSKRYITFSEKTLELSPNFRIIFATKIENPKYSPFYHLYCNFVNCLITEESLIEKLLGDAVELEQPDDYKIRKDLVQSIYEDSQLLH